MSNQSTKETTKQQKAVEDFVNGQVASLSAAGDAFAKPVEDEFAASPDTSDLEDLLWSSWNAFLHVVKTSAQDTTKRQRLVDFILALSKRPALKKDDRLCKVWDLTVWSDLPVFGASMREMWNQSMSTEVEEKHLLTDEAPTDSSSEQDQVVWLNISAFTANLVATARTETADKPDFTLYAIWALRQGLEETKPSNIEIEAAATWLICATPALADISKSKQSFDGKVARAGSAFSDHEWNGFSSDRWHAWLSQLDAVDAASLGSRGESLVTKAKQKVQALSA